MNESIAKLNKIEGFNPEDYAREIADEGESPRKYLDVMWRKVWFRLKYPEGKITKTIVRLNEKVALVEAKVYFDKNDAPENCVASAFAYREFDPSNRIGARYVESAETAAVGRALADAGFGLQFCSEIGEDKERDIVDSPVSSPKKAAEAPKETLNEPEDITAETKAEKQEIMDDRDDLPLDAPAEKQEAPTKTEVNETTNPLGFDEEKVNEMFDKKAPVEEILKKMTFDTAMYYKVDFGLCKGKTLAQIAYEKPENIKWYVEKYSGPNNALRAAARLMADYAAQQKKAG